MHFQILTHKMDPGPHDARDMGLPIAITGSSVDAIELMYDVLSARGYRPWIVWNSTYEHPPLSMATKAHARLLTYTARAYAAECQILMLRRVVDSMNADHAWTLDADLVTAKDIPAPFDMTDDADVLLGLGYSRFSRKALECISRDFGTGLDYSSLEVRTV